MSVSEETLLFTVAARDQASAIMSKVSDTFKKLGLDGSEGASKASAALRSLDDSTAKSEAVSQSYARAIEGQKAAQQTLVDSTGRLAAAQDAAAKAAGAAGTAQSKAAAEAAAAVEAAAARQEAALKGLGDAESLVGKRAQESAAAQGEAAAKTASFRDGLNTAAAGAAIVAVGLGVVAVKSIEVAGNYQTLTTRLVTSAGESTSAINQVSQGMLTMAGQVGISADDLATGMYTVESAGYHGAAALDVLKAAAQGAKMEGAQLKTVADAVSTALNDYHQPASDASKVTSELVTAVGLGKTNMEEFSGSLSSITPLASSVGITLADVTGSLAAMTMHGMSAEQASNNLADTLRHLIAPTQQQRAELAQLGLSASDVQTSLGTKGLQGTLEQLSQAILQKMGPSGKMMLDAFNTSKDAANNFKEAIAKAPPAVAELANKLADGSITLGDYRKAIKGLPADQSVLASAFIGMYSAADGFTNSLKNGSPQAQSYTQALKAVTGDSTGLNTALMLTGENSLAASTNIDKISKATSDAQGNVKGWGEIQGTFNQKMDEFKAAVHTVAIDIGSALLPAVSKIMSYITPAATAIAEFATKHQMLVTVIFIVVGALALLVLGVWALVGAFGVLAANPIVALVMVIIGVLVLLEVKFHFVEAAVRGVSGFFSNEFMPALRAVGAWFSGPFLDAFKSVGEWFAGPFVNFFKMVGSAIAKPFQVAFDWIKNNIIQPFMGWWNGHWEELKDAWNGIWKVLTIIFDAFVGTIKIVIDELVGWFRIAWDEISVIAKIGIAIVVGVIKVAWAGVVFVFKMAWDQVVMIFTIVWNTLKAIVTLGIDEIMAVVKIVWGAVVMVFKIAWDTIVAIFSVFLDIITLHWSKAWDDIKALGEQVWNAIKDFLKTVLDAIVGLVIQWVNVVINWVIGLYNAVKTYLTNLWHAAVQLFTSLLNDVIAIWNTIVNAVETFAKNLWHDVIGFFTNMWQGIKSLFGTLLSDVSSIWNAIWSKITSLASTIWHDVTSTFTNLKNGMIQIFKDIANFAFIDPINWVINTVINGGIEGILKTIDSVIGTNWSVHVNPLTHFATGGVVPGYSPGNDSVPALLSPGEGILRPEVVNMLGGPAAIYALNSMAGSPFNSNPVTTDSNGVQHASLGGLIGDIWGGIKDIGGDIWGGIKSAFNWIRGAVATGAQFVLDHTVYPMADKMFKSGGLFGQAPAKTTHKIGDGLVAMLRGQDKKDTAAMQGTGSPYTGGGSLGAWIAAAIADTGVPASWGGPLGVLIMRESGGNPNAINLTDSNAKAGHPSQGLMQTIPGTFEAYRDKNLVDNIRDPVANIVAGINYIKARYGSIFNVQQANASLPPKGYDQGGWLTPGYTLTHNASGHPEMVLPHHMSETLMRLHEGMQHGKWGKAFGRDNDRWDDRHNDRDHDWNGHRNDAWRDAQQLRNSALGGFLGSGFSRSLTTAQDLVGDKSMLNALGMSGSGSPFSGVFLNSSLDSNGLGNAYNQNALTWGTRSKGNTGLTHTSGSFFGQNAGEMNEFVGGLFGAGGGRGGYSGPAPSQGGHYFDFRGSHIMGDQDMDRITDRIGRRLSTWGLPSAGTRIR